MTKYIRQKFEQLQTIKPLLPKILIDLCLSFEKIILS